MPKIRDLKKRIDQLRLQLYRLVATHGTGHPAVIACSSELDEALNAYYRARGQRSPTVGRRK